MNHTNQLTPRLTKQTMVKTLKTTVSAFILIWSAATAVADEIRTMRFGEQVLVHTHWQEVLNHSIDRVINPDDYQCLPNNDVIAWLMAQLEGVDPTTLQILRDNDVFSTLAPYKIFFDNDATDETIGLYGQYTQETRKRHKSNQRFWDVPTDDVLLMGMHGRVLADDTKMVPYVQWALGMSMEQAQGLVDALQGLIENDPVLDYDNPLFSFNAFAASFGGAPIPGIGVIPDKIVLGDGLLQLMEALGLDDVASDFIHAHEFAHHVQFEIGANTPPSPEATRRTELMADAFAAYYSSHARGATFQAKRFADVMNAAFVAGDCAFASPGHHGTPNQREAAAAWGGEVSASADNQGKIFSSNDMLERFEAILPTLVAPDAE